MWVWGGSLRVVGVEGFWKRIAQRRVRVDVVLLVLQIKLLLLLLLLLRRRRRLLLLNDWVVVVGMRVDGLLPRNRKEDRRGEKGAFASAPWCEFWEFRAESQCWG